MNFLKIQQSWFALCHKPVAKYPKHFLMLLGFILLCNNPAFARESKSLTEILQQATEPAGIVIEIVTSDDENLEWALPQANNYIKKLRDIFPNIPVAIVTHGDEQFALSNDEKESHTEIHRLAKSLNQENIPVHVCETYASWHGMNTDDFPDYVNVAASGPAQINNYLALDYELIVISDE